MKNVLCCASLMLAAMSMPARADGIVLESYTGGKPDDVARYISPILDELAKKDFHAGYDAVGRRFEASVSRPAATAAGLPATFKADVERAKGEWARGKFDEALKLLTALVEAAHTNPAAFLDDQSLRDALQDALVTVALSRKGQGDPDGMHQAFAELIRSFPRATPGPAYGTEANRMFEAVRKELAGRDGKLIVRVSDDTNTVYIDEELTAQGTTRRAGPAGEYRVLVRSPRQLSRLHRVVVHTGEETAATVDMGFDNALHLAPDWSGLVFASAAEREQLEGAYAAQLANLIDAHAVALVGTETLQGRTVIVGALINLKNGRELRRASIAADSAPQADRLRALARFLAGGEEPGSGIEVLVNGNGDGPPLPLTPRAVAATVPASAPEPSAGRWHGWKWIAGGAAVGALGGSTTLFVFNGRCSKPPPQPRQACPTQYDTLAPALGLLGGGVVLAALTAYLWMSEAPGEPARTAYVVPTAGGALAGFAATF